MGEATSIQARGSTPAWATLITELAHLCEVPDGEIDAEGVAGRMGRARPAGVTAPLGDVLIVEKALGRLLSLGWRGPAGCKSVHRLLYEFAKYADYDDGTAERLLRHALEFPASPLQRRLTRRRLARVREGRQARQ